jgi:hypothetical protein
MKNNIIKYFMAGSLLASFSCTSDFLDVDSREDVDVVDATTTYDPVMLVNGIYG